MTNVYSAFREQLWWVPYIHDGGLWDVVTAMDAYVDDIVNLPILVVRPDEPDYWSSDDYVAALLGGAD